jgi:large subunit ribosomal protein L28
MTRPCEVTGSRPQTGKHVSRSHRRSNRWFHPNTHERRFWLPSERRWVTLHVSTRGLRTIDKRGIEAVVADLRRRGARI